MFYINKFLFGVDPEQQYQNQADSTGEQLKTQQVDDWVVVETSGENNGSNLQEEGSDLTMEHAELREEEFVAQDQTDVAPLPPRRIAQIIPPSLLSPQQIVKNVHTAHRSLRIKTQENISNSKCDRQNKVRDYQGYTKGNNRKNKRMKPSGCKASRFNQRM